MPARSFRILSVRLHLSAAALLASLAHGGEPATAEVAQHPLVIAAEALYQQQVPMACDELLRLAPMAAGLTDDGRAHLQFVAAMRSLDEGNEPGARSAIARALEIDPWAEPPPFASSRLRPLSVGANFFWQGSNEVRVGAGAGAGHASLVVGGQF